MGCFGGSSSKSDAEEDKRRKEANKKIEKQIQKDKQIYRATHRLLLLGWYAFLNRYVSENRLMVVGTRKKNAFSGITAGTGALQRLP